MSTRCTVHFTYSTDLTPVAIVYRHSDGYPESMLPFLDDFFKAVEAQTSDTRFGDPSYLAAKFVVFLADSFTAAKARPLDFLSVGIVREDPDDIQHRYTLVCSGPNRPSVIHKEI